MILYICYVRRKAWDPAATISSLVVWQGFDFAATKEGCNIDSNPEVPDLCFCLLIILPSRLGMRSNQLDEVAWWERSLLLEHGVQG